MSSVLHFAAGLLLLLAVALMLPALLLLMQVLCAHPGRLLRSGLEPQGQREPPTIVVLMPAHNEELGIGAVLADLLPQLEPGDRLLVVADNCSDATASVARAAGAEVVERHDLSRRGKGYALDFGVRSLASTPPEVVVIVDADCWVQGGSLALLAQQCLRSGCPAQALYLMRPPAGAAFKVRLAAFAWVLKNCVRPLGYQRLGLPCQLMGTGMAFPWRIIQSAPLASGHLVEDLQLGLELAAQGTAPQFCPGAVVISEFPTAADALSSQRTRWEHGHVAMIGTAPRLMMRALAKRQAALASLVLDLCVPPLAALVLLSAVVTVLAGLLAGAGGAKSPLIISLLTLVAAVSAVLLAWHRFGRHLVSFRELFSAPVYALAKLPIYAALLTKRQLAWVRTHRGGKPTGKS